jgi:redox-sensitive bicupin YhaK (pirin superfamily)
MPTLITSDETLKILDAEGMQRFLQLQNDAVSAVMSASGQADEKPAVTIWPFILNSSDPSSNSGCSSPWLTICNG